MELISMGEDKAMGNIPLKFLPSQVADLKLWFRFNTGITVTGSGVSQWDDQSGNGYHLKQANDANRMTKEADGSILGNGIDQFLVTDAFTELSQPNTIIMLFNPITWTNTDNVYDGISATKRHSLFQTNVTPQMKINAGSSTASAIAPALGSDVIVSLAYNGASSSMQVNNETPVTGDAGTNGLTGLTLGAKNDLTQLSNIKVKEFILFDGILSAEDLAKNIKHLAQVGGLSI